MCLLMWLDSRTPQKCIFALKSQAAMIADLTKSKQQLEVMKKRAAITQQRTAVATAADPIAAAAEPAARPKTPGRARPGGAARPKSAAASSVGRLASPVKAAAYRDEELDPAAALLQGRKQQHRWGRQGVLMLSVSVILRTMLEAF